MIGQTISRYKILAKLGEGGMGVVYEAEDTKLDRLVALKFLPEHLLGSDDVRKRFEREAKSSAALSHANICHVYEIDEAEGKTFIAMALIEGESLDSKIAQGPLKLDEALSIAQQVAKGLEAAHKRSIVHRDIKPENIMVGEDGHVTIMDFGLAQLTEASRLTKTDETVGTVSYMSPEQTEGSGTDHRTDIWSLGVVLYEMITGQQPFKGDYDKAVMYSILNEEPEPMTAVRTGVPMGLEWLANKCLAKDIEERYQHTDELLLDLQGLRKKLESSKSTTMPVSGTGAQHAGPLHSSAEASEHPLVKYRVIDNLEEQGDLITYHAEDTQLQRSVAIRVVPESTFQRFERRQRLQALGFVAAVAVATVAIGLLVFQSLNRPAATDAMPLSKLSFTSPGRLSRQGLAAHVSISPNGRHVALLAGNERTLWIRDLANEQAREIPGTENAQYVFWSPDSAFVGFATDRELKKVAVEGAATTALCRLPMGWSQGGSWSPDGDSIVFASGNPLKLYVVPARGGSPELLFDPKESEMGPHAVSPEFLPSEAAARSIVFAEGSFSDTEIVLTNLETGERRILGAGARPHYSQTGHIVYQTNRREGGLWAQPFSIKTLKPTGEAFPIAQNAESASIADDGTLVYVDFGVGERQLVWMDREGRKLGTMGQPQDGISRMALSPDETRVAVTAFAEEGTEIWVHEVERPVKTRVTFSGGGFATSSHWSPSGSELLFASRREGSQDFDVYVKSADGTGEARLLFGSETLDYASDWSTDGRYVLADHAPSGDPANVLLWERKERGQFEASLLFASQYVEKAAKVSPDGRYVAYVSDESGVFEVYVQQFPEGGGKRQISISGGTQPRWSHDGTELFLVDDDALMAADVEQGEKLSVSAPKQLFRAAGLIGSEHPHYDVSSDGRFILAEDIAVNADTIHVVQNWYEEFRDREQD